MSLNYSEINKAFSTAEYKTALTEAELEAELYRVVEEQVYGAMDWARARAYWKSRLPVLVEHFSTDVLAHALADALRMVHATRRAPPR